MKSSILSYAEQIPMVDTHEHIGDRGLGAEEKNTYDLDYLFCTPYISNRLVSAGVDPGVFSGRRNEPERFRRLIASNLDLVRGTCQYQNFARALADLYGFAEESLGLATWEDLNARIVAAYASGHRTWCREVFRRANIDRALKNTHLPYYTDFLPSLGDEERTHERRLFDTLPAFDWALFGYEREHDRTGLLQRTQAALGMDPRTLDDYLDLVRAFVAAAKDHGAVGLKCTAAYFRLLDFDIVEEADARPVYDKKPQDVTPEQAKAFQDFVMQEIVRSAGEHHLPIHVHTGAIFGTKMDLAGLAPSNLCRLLSWSGAEKTSFVLLHGGFPYTGEITVLAKTFPNVYLDYADIGMISIDTLKRCLHEWLECVPINKIVQGGDALNIEQCYGVMVRQREALAEVLAEKVGGGRVSFRLAKVIVERILSRNARELFRLDQRPHS